MTAGIGTQETGEVATTRAINISGRWVWLLLGLGIPAVAVIGASAASPVIMVAYLSSAVVLAGSALGIATGRLSRARTMQAIMLVLLVLYSAGVVDLHTAEYSVEEAAFRGFRSLAILSAIGSLVLGPRGGLIVGSVVAVQSAVSVAVLGGPLTGTDAVPIGMVEMAVFMVSMLAVHRVMSSRMEVLEQSAEEASESAELAFRDDLTGLPNRRQLTVHLSASAARAREGGVADAVVMFDLDHFKKINDTLGHDVGDEVLRRTAAIASAAIREGDMVGRWGGEEFVALLDGADAEEASTIAERCRQALASVPGRARVTASFGITTMSVDDTVTDALRRADLALYQAKQGGRDRVVVYRARDEAYPGDRRHPKSPPEPAPVLEPQPLLDDPHSSPVEPEDGPRRDWPGAAKPR